MDSANAAMTGSYSYPMVALSLLIAVLASYVALDLAGRVTIARGWTRAGWLTGGATAMGFGIWSMHYIGMLAFQMPLPVAYHWPTVLISLLAAVSASAASLYVVSRRELHAPQIWAGSIVMAAGIAGMHYIGMAAMRLAAQSRFDPLLVTLSVVLAIVASLAALQLGFRFRQETKRTMWRMVSGAMFLGGAIAGMHYIGMAAASFTLSTMPPDMSNTVSMSALGTAGIATFTLVILSLALLTSLMDRRFYAQSLALEATEQRYHHLFERSLAGIYRATVTGQILDCNDAFLRIVGYDSPEERRIHSGPNLVHNFADWETFLAVLKERRALTNFERCLRRRDNGPLWVLENANLFEGKEDAPSLVEATLIDITERKRMETELREANLLLEARQHEIDEELQLAARVQNSLAPSNLTWHNISVEAFYQPVRTIGGDFGLVAPRTECLTLLVCDVSGHGISSALVANRIYTEVIGQIEAGRDLGPMLRHLNEFVLGHLGTSEFYFTLSAVRLNRNGQELVFAGAGHPPALIVHPGQTPRLLESQSAVLGLLEHAVNGEGTIQVPIQSGDRLVIYTDGFTESFNPQGDMLGLDGFSAIVQETAHLTLAGMKQGIVDRVTTWRAGPAADDMSLVVVGIG